MVLPVFVAVVLFFALLISYPWIVLTIGTVCYLASLPVGWLSHRQHERKDSVAAGATQAGAEHAARARMQNATPLSAVPETPPDHPTRH
jgi:CDP-diacylglycerol--serine O-phosphatidyltransferase